MMNNDEFSPLNPSAARHKKLSLYLWWALNIALVIFVFLAFVLSAASLAKEKKISSEINNNYYKAESSGLLGNYKVAKNHEVKKGDLVSFTDFPNEIGRGLGPVYDSPAFILEAYSTAAYAEVATFNQNASIYVFATGADRQQLRVRAINTLPNSNVTLGGRQNLTLANNISYVHVVTLNDHAFAILTTSFNNDTQQTLIGLVTGTTSSDYSQVMLHGYQLLQTINAQDTVRDLLALRDETTPNRAWLLLSWAPSGTGCSLLWWTFDLTEPNYLRPIVPKSQFSFECTWPMRSVYLSGGYFAIANDATIGIAHVDFATETVSAASQLPFGTIYETLALTLMPDRGYIIAAGIQRDDLEGPLLLTQVVEWKSAAPFLIIHHPTVLIDNLSVAPYHHHVRACYVSPDNYHPYGALIYTYIDGRSLLPTLVRGKVTAFENYLWILPSPRILMSTIPYSGWFNDNSTFGPLLFSANNKAYIAYQSKPASFNSFYWSGGYRAAGLAQADGPSQKNVDVVRYGIAQTFQWPLTPGFSYYAGNAGFLMPTLSSTEMFTPNGIPYKIGTALTDKEMLMDFEVIERINR